MEKRDDIYYLIVYYLTIRDMERRIRIASGLRKSRNRLRNAVFEGELLTVSISWKRYGVYRKIKKELFDIKGQEFLDNLFPGFSLRKRNRRKVNSTSRTIYAFPKFFPSRLRTFEPKF